MLQEKSWTILIWWHGRWASRRPTTSELSAQAAIEKSTSSAAALSGSLSGVTTTATLEAVGVTAPAPSAPTGELEMSAAPKVYTWRTKVMCSILNGWTVKLVSSSLLLIWLLWMKRKMSQLHILSSELHNQLSSFIESKKAQAYLGSIFRRDDWTIFLEVYSIHY